MGRLIGIDLGTTNSVVGIVDGPQPKVLDNREARSQTRSVVSLRRKKGKAQAGDGELIVGDTAYDNWPFAPKDTVISIKRLMGRAVSDPEVQKAKEWALYDVVEPRDGTRDSVRVVLGGKQYSPVEVSAMILRKLKEDAEFKLGEEVSHAVITVPAYFSQIQKNATVRAGLKAGLKVIRILDEPTAAAIAFGIDQHSDEARTVLVYDLGGGTFDISLLVCAGSQFAPLSIEGDMWLGGDNMDEALVEHALAWVKSEYGLEPRKNFRFLAELRKAAQKAKEQLTSSRSASIIVPSILQDDDGNPIDVDVDVSREEFERMILPLVGRYRACGCGVANHATADACAVCGRSIKGAAVKDGRTVQLVKKAIKEASYTLDDIQYVLMAGNSTNVPLVQQAMEDLFGAERVVRKIHPKHCVAMGAAIVAARVGPQLICQAADPDDPKSECGEVNATDARACRKCGASLAVEAAAGGPEQDSGPVAGGGIVLGGITAFHYGTQSAGDKFHVFIKKGDPYPTEEPVAQSFYTNVPGQRMVSIPVYGGENMEKASANAKQGEAFAVLPGALPKSSAVRIKLWLDWNGVFDLSAHLEDGRDLKPWIVQGEQDARAIQAIERAFEKIQSRAEAMPPESKADAERAFEQALDKLRNGRFEEAEQVADDIQCELPTVVSASAEDRAETLLGFADFLLQQYGWALDPDTSYALNKLVAEVKSASASGDKRKLAAAVEKLERATDILPDHVKLLLGARAAIAQRVRAADPAQAAELMRELDQAEDAMKQNPIVGIKRLQGVLTRIMAAFEEISKSSAGLTCSQGHPVPPGQRKCPACGEDTWGLAGSGYKSSGPMRR